MKRNKPATVDQQKNQKAAHFKNAMISKQDYSRTVIETIEPLLKVLPEFKNQELGHHLINAMKSDSEENITLLLQQKYNFINGQTILGVALLQWALINKYDDIVKLIVSRGIDCARSKLITDIL